MKSITTLSIGDYVNYNGKMQRVRWLIEEGAGFTPLPSKASAAPIKQISAVLLTPELLELAGFVNISSAACPWADVYTIPAQGEAPPIYIEREDGGAWHLFDARGTDVLTLHRLQHLLRLLYGLELDFDKPFLNNELPKKKRHGKD